MKKILFVLFIFLLSCSKEKDNDLYLYQLERAYFEGQKDVLNGDIRIKLDNDSNYIWDKSPWDNNDLPIYDPCLEYSKNIKL